MSSSPVDNVPFGVGVATDAFKLSALQGEQFYVRFTTLWMAGEECSEIVGENVILWQFSALA